MGRRTPTGNWNGKCCWPVFAAQSPPTPPTLAYHALVPDAAGLMTPVLVGPGTVSEGRVSDILLPDYQSVHKTFGTSQLGWEGGRVVSGTEIYGTDDGGQPLAEMPWLVHAPQATNVVKYSRDLNEWTLFTANSTTGDLGIDGLSLASRVEATGDYAYAWTRKTIAGIQIGDEITSLMFALKETADTQYDGLSLAEVTNDIRGTAAFNKEDGYGWQAGESGPALTNEQGEVTDSGAHWKVSIGAEASASTNELVTMVLTSRFKVDDPVLYQSVVGESVAVDAVCTFLNTTFSIGKHLPPIQTSGAEATRDTCALALDAGAHDDTGGRYTLDVVVTGSCSILGDFLTYDADTLGGQFRLTDGTQTAVRIGHPPGQYSIEAIYGPDGMNLIVDGLQSGSVAYNGTLHTGPVQLFKAASVVGKIRDIKRYTE